jgi:hypothetical protein
MLLRLISALITQIHCCNVHAMQAFMAMTWQAGRVYCQTFAHHKDSTACNWHLLTIHQSTPSVADRKWLQQTHLTVTLLAKLLDSKAWVQAFAPQGAVVPALLYCPAVRPCITPRGTALQCDPAPQPCSSLHGWLGLDTLDCQTCLGQADINLAVRIA